MIVSIDKIKQKRKELNSKKNNLQYAVSNKIQYMLMNGYRLTICSDYDKSRCEGLASLKYTDNPLDCAEEIDVEPLLETKTGITKYLHRYQGCIVCLLYDGSKKKYFGRVYEIKTEGPQNDVVGYELAMEDYAESYVLSECITKLDIILRGKLKAGNKKLTLE